MNHMTPDDGRAALIGIPEHRNLSVSAALHNEVVLGLSKRLAIAEKTIADAKAALDVRNIPFGADVLAVWDRHIAEAKAALRGYDTAKEAL